MDHAAPAVTAALQALIKAITDSRAEHRLASLDSKSRLRFQGRWFANGHGFASRASAALRSHHGLLADKIPHSADDIEAQRQRVIILEHALIYYTQLTKDFADTLLMERAALTSMASGVLECLQWIFQQPYQRPEIQQLIGGSIANLRNERDRKNRKISASLKRGKTRQLPAAATAPAPPALPEPGAAEEPVALPPRRLDKALPRGRRTLA